MRTKGVSNFEQNVCLIMEMIFERADEFTLRFLKNHESSLEHHQIIRLIYRVLLLPDNCLQVLRFSMTQLEQFILLLDNVNNDIHPLLQAAKQRLKNIMIYYQ
ncbi:unnamed protein product [Paramecium sonneborni]|uniref:Uncharacterized protein n=1 Tax=Paramecium sonneborni TaxID=65129 RepID=A0A8S1P0T1_9CILI|nr:unnamed protein product [Paramecium sonneborni]